MANVIVPAGETDLGNVTFIDKDSLFFKAGEQSITAGGDQSGLTNGFTNLVFDRGTRISFPTTNVLKCSVDGVVKFRGAGGRIYCQPSGTTPANQWDRVEHVGAQDIRLISGGTVDLYHQSGGYLDVSGSVILNTLYTASRCNVKYHATALDQLHAGLGAEVTLDRSIDGSGVSYIARGAVVHCKQETVNLSQLPAVTNGDLFVDGTLNWEGGGIAEIILGPNGYVDFSKAPAAFSVTVRGDWRAIQRSVWKSGYEGVTITVTYDPWFADHESDRVAGVGFGTSGNPAL